jgi:tRNA pseudouridine55 synthase
MAEAGFVIVNKPSGMTSREAVDLAVRAIPKVKIGHAGTLDPLASGILIICIGAATRLVEEIQRWPKTYRVLIRLGARSDTLDADGVITVDPSPKVPEASLVEEIMPTLSGRVLQVPPEYSALKVKGKRAYDLARTGRPVALKPRLVQIDRVSITGYQWPRLELEIDCGSGTYVRSIARDAGEMLGCGGYVETLVRTRVGPFPLEQAVDAGTMTTAEAIGFHLRPMIDAVADLTRIVLNQTQVDAVTRGGRLSECDGTHGLKEFTRVALVTRDGRLVALAEFDPALGWIQPRKVFL